MPSIPYVLPQLMNLTPLAASGNSSPVSLPPRSATMNAVVYLKFTLGSLTNGTFTIQLLNPDGSTWCDVVSTAALVANSNLAIPVNCAGAKQLRVRYVTTGTLTSSAAVIDCTVQQ